MNIDALKFMSIGGNCACIGFLGPNRLRGPVDNVIVGNARCLELLLTNQYYNFIIKESFTKVKRKKSWPTDYEYFSQYVDDTVWIAHHDPQTQSYHKELKKRCEAFNSFYYKVLEDPNYYFTFNINEFMFDKKNQKLNHDFTKSIIAVLNKFNILNKTIFVGTKTINNKNKTWNYYTPDFDKYIKKYNLKYVEIIDNNIWDTSATHAQFLNKVWRLLNNIHSKKWGNVVVAIAKNEELYINDWVKYHLSLGFDKIFIYDNNDIQKAPIINYIDKSMRAFVTVINVKGQHKQGFQQECYNNFLKNYYKLFDWCAFLDLDEYTTGISNINLLLNAIKIVNPEANQIRIKWHLFGDDNQITRDMSIPVYNCFKQVITDKGKFSDAGKCIVKGGIASLRMNSVHYASLDNTMEPAIECYPSGIETVDKIVIDNEKYTAETIFINHFMTKTLSEFITQKLNRGDAVKKDRKIDLSYYFEINERTLEKIEYLRKIGVSYNE